MRNLTNTFIKLKNENQTKIEDLKKENQTKIEALQKENMDSKQKMDELLSQLNYLKNLRIKNENNIDLTYSNIDSNNNKSIDIISEINNNIKNSG